jgi:hypothetical protein
MRLHRDGATSDAHDLLAPVNGRSAEGFSTPDPKEAKELFSEPS